MKQVYVAIFLLLFASCKKKIQEITEDLIIQAMTNGEWVITSFTQNGNNITTDFSSYKFKFYSNKTVDAIKNGSVENNGTWDGNANTRNIMANFQSANYPLIILNGTWHVTNNSWTFVEATQTNGLEVKSLRLEKQ